MRAEMELEREWEMEVEEAGMGGGDKVKNEKTANFLEQHEVDV